jgi:hypothetical protein
MSQVQAIVLLCVCGVFLLWCVWLCVEEYRAQSSQMVWNYQHGVPDFSVISSWSALKVLFQGLRNALARKPPQRYRYEIKKWVVKRAIAHPCTCPLHHPGK